MFSRPNHINNYAQQILGLAIFISLIVVACQSDDNGPDSSSSAVPSARSGAATGSPAGQSSPKSASTSTTEPTAPSADPQLAPNGHFTEVQIDEDGTKHLIPLDQVFAGGPPKDGIPSIDAPLFVGPDEWESLDYQDDGLVIGIEVDGQRRAYPFQVLVWHELVNDSFGGVPLLISYCPLCGTGIVFERLIDGEPVEFGVSGQLYNSDLLMYDRLSDTLWSQITGTAVVGARTGERLAFYPSEIMTWADWQATYPNSEVLGRDTGYNRDYDVDPYGNYYVDGTIMFPVSERDDRLQAKTRVTGVEVDEETFGAYPDQAVLDHGPINDVLGGVPLVIVANPMSGNNIVVFERRLDDGRTLTFEVDGDGLVDVESGTTWSFEGKALDGALAGSQLTELQAVKGFWFAWFAFHPQTALWESE